MANPISETTFEVDGTVYTFVFGTWARAVLQRKVGKLAGFFERWEEWGDEEVLQVFHAGLQRHHGDLTEREASDLIDALGPDRMAQIFVEAFTLSTPEAAKGTGRPQRPAASRKSRTS